MDMPFCTKDRKIDCDVKWQHTSTTVQAHWSVFCSWWSYCSRVPRNYLASYVSIVLYWYLNKVVVALHCVSCWRVSNNNNNSWTWNRNSMRMGTPLQKWGHFLVICTVLSLEWASRKATILHITSQPFKSTSR